jgi:hypothetical protein
MKITGNQGVFALITANFLFAEGLKTGDIGAVPKVLLTGGF